MACKFKVGDRVELIEDYMYHKKGEQFIVDGFDHTEPIGCDVVDSKGNGFYVFQKRLKAVESTPTHELHITVKGRETIGVYKHDGKTDRAVAKCSPEDTFDFATGVKLVCERLGVLPTENKPIETIEPTKPTPFTGKMICIKSGHHWWTVGKIYTVINGKVESDDGDTYPKKGEFYTSADDCRHMGCLETHKVNMRNEFIPLVE